MITSGSDLIRSALQTLGALASGETPNADEATDALLRLNDLIDSWATQALTVFYLQRTVVPLSASTASYTIGVGGVINIVRPVEITAAGLIQDTSVPSPVEVPIPVFTDQQWIGLGMRTLTGTYAQGVYYDHNSVGALATLAVYPIPTGNGTQLVLYTPSALTEMTLAGGLTFPPGYRRLLRYGLARDLAAEFGGWDGAKETIFHEAMADVQRKNLRMSDLRLDPALTGAGHYNIFSDTP